MPTYACSTAAGRLTPAQKADIVRSITAIHHEETGAPRYFVQVIFYELAPGNHFIGGQSAPAGQIWNRRDILAGRSEGQKRKLILMVPPDGGKNTAIAAEGDGVYPGDTPAHHIDAHR